MFASINIWSEISLLFKFYCSFNILNDSVFSYSFSVQKFTKALTMEADVRAKNNYARQKLDYIIGFVVYDGHL